MTQISHSKGEIDNRTGSNTCPKKLYDDYVLLTDYEYELLSRKMTDRQLQHYIDKLNNYIGSTGKEYKNHYYTIKLWYEKDLKNTPEDTKLNIYS